MIFGIVYERKSPSGKRYIGQTIDEHRRQTEWMNLNTPYTSENSKIDNARKKYGPENFEYRVLYVGVFGLYKEAISVLDIVETDYISFYDTVNSGYNICSGGGTPSTRRDAKVTLVFTLSGEFVGKFNSLVEASTSLRIDERKMRSNAQRKTHNVLGKFLAYFKEDFSDDILKRDIEYYNNMSVNKPIVKLTLDGELIKRYKNVKEAYNDFNKDHLGINFNTKLILSCCNQNLRIRSLAGYRWAFEEDYIKNKKGGYYEKVGKFTKPIVQISRNDKKVVNLFNSIVDVDEFLINNNLLKRGKHGSSQICACCNSYSIDANILSRNNKQKTAYGYIWMYKSDYDIVSKDDLEAFLIERYETNKK